MNPVTLRRSVNCHCCEYIQKLKIFLIFKHVQNLGWIRIRIRMGIKMKSGIRIGIKKQ
jgi:hypothetical protein